MSLNKSDIFNQIMDNMTDSESGAVASSDDAGEMEKVASDVTPRFTDTEDLKYPKVPNAPKSKVEKKLGMAGLSPKGGSHEKFNVIEAAANKTCGMGTENIKVPKMKVDSSTFLQKRAAIYGELSGAAGFDLEKVAGDANQHDYLIKQAEAMFIETADDLEKVAHEMADAMADRILERIGKSI